MEREIGKGKEGKEWKGKERKLTGDGDRDWQTNGDGKEMGKGKETRNRNGKEENAKGI